jgi:hypothetical protein
MSDGRDVSTGVEEGAGVSTGLLLLPTGADVVPSDGVVSPGVVGEKTDEGSGVSTGLLLLPTGADVVPVDGIVSPGVVGEKPEEGSGVSTGLLLLPTGTDVVPNDGFASGCVVGFVSCGVVGEKPVVGITPSPAGNGEGEGSRAGALDPEGAIMGIIEFEIEGKSAVLGAMGEKDPQFVLHSKMDARQAP